MGLWTSVPVSALRANQTILKQEFILEDNQKGRMSAFLSLSLSGKQSRKEISLIMAAFWFIATCYIDLSWRTALIRSLKKGQS